MSMTEKGKRVCDPERYIIQVQGVPKIGKTSLVAANDDTFFFDFEDGLKDLEVYSEPIKSWERCLEVCKELQELENPPFKHIGLDGTNRMIALCTEYVGEIYKFDDPSDLGFAKGWRKTREEFIRVISKLAMLPFGLWLIGHTKISKRQITIGSKKQERDFALSTITDNVRQAVDQFVDLTLYCHFDDDADDGSRIISCRSSRYWAAGGRILMPETIPLDRKKFDEEFAKALLNQKEETNG